METSTLEIADEYKQVSELRQALQGRSAQWMESLDKHKTLVAVNQSIVDDSFPLNDGDEVAFSRRLPEANMSVSVQLHDFDVAKEYQMLSQDNPVDGAVVFFVGKVRNFNQNKAVTGLCLEHYPAMTEKSLQEIVEQAHARWNLGKVRVVHRYGELELGEQIVFVGTTSVHRQAAF